MPNSFYKEKISSTNVLIKDQNKKLKTILYSRVGTFICFIFIIFLAIKLDNISILYFLFLPILLFAFFVKYNAKEKLKLSILQNILTINTKEIASLNGDFSTFKNGKKFSDSQHSYSHDLDIFGEKSIYQYINRTTSTFSEKKLADYFVNFVTNKIEIQNRQDAVKELSSETNWRQEFLANGQKFESDANDIEELIHWKSEEISIFKNEILWKILLWIIPILVVLATFLSIQNIVPSSFLLFIYLIPLSLVGKKLKIINHQHLKISKYLDILKQNNILSQFIENKEFKSNKLKEIKSNLLSNNKKASEEINKLASIAQQLDNRSNPVFAFLMNTFFLWDLNYVLKLKKWLQSNEGEIKNWFNAVHEMEVYTSFANYFFNNPTYTFPILSENIILKTTEIGHPLLLSQNRVSNDFELTNLQNFVIITGANMAGKSTFLRTIGINITLAMCGLPVCAKEFEFTPTPLFSSMRTSDSLSENESYFYSELKRLKMIVDKLKNGEQLFVILDEILKGTNSKDKAEGSKKFIKQLLKHQVAGIIATHDLSLCSVKEDFPTLVKNNYFDVEIINDKLDFDYKLKQGICSNMNAEFLMKKMGIIN